MMPRYLAAAAAAAAAGLVQAALFSRGGSFELLALSACSAALVTLLTTLPAELRHLQRELFCAL